VKPTIAELFDPRVASHAVRFSDPLDPLYEEEARCVERAVEKRRHEFRAGRHCARAALRTLGLPAGPIPRRTDRAPGWPVGSVGSITHTGDLASGLAAAVVAPDSVALGLGVDAESDSDLSDAITERIVTRAEYRFLDRQREQRRGLIAKLFFCGSYAKLFDVPSSDPDPPTEYGRPSRSRWFLGGGSASSRVAGHERQQVFERGERLAVSGHHVLHPAAHSTAQ
jgi:hypothetical protein